MKKILKRINNSNAFMGPTHALSAVAVFLAVAAFFPNILAVLLNNEKSSIPILISTLLLIIGSSLLPDFDNVKSTAISVLGVIGTLISQSMRAIARTIYTLTRSKYDKPNADPHRGFWHTIIAGISVGFLGYLLIFTTNKLSITVFEKELSIGKLFLTLFLTISIQLMMTVFFKKQMKKMSSTIFGPLLMFVIGFFISLVLVISLPNETNFKWIWYAISSGWIIHILGDTFTTSGTPLLFPVPFKGHRWWNHRWPPRIRANGPIEHYVFIPLFTLIILLSLATILLK